MFSLNKTGAIIMTTTGTTTMISDGARLPRLRRGLNVRNHNSTRVQGRGLHLNHNVTAVIARKPQVKAALTYNHNSTRVYAAKVR